MARSLTISSKGQITVPIAVRKRLGVKPGDKVEISDDNVLRRAQKPGNPFEKFAGCLPVFEDVDQINAWVRELRDPESEGA